MDRLIRNLKDLQEGYRKGETEKIGNVVRTFDMTH